MDKEPEFKPKIGQIDYTHIRRAPVINCIVEYGGKILLLQRSSIMRLYPNFWSGVSGFLDDDQSLEDKAKEELREETGIKEIDIVSITAGDVFEEEDEQYGKTWIVHPVLVKIKTDFLNFDWETQNHAWIKPEEYKNFNVLPNFDRVLRSFYDIN